MSVPIVSVTLSGAHASLVPLALEHEAALAEAVRTENSGICGIFDRAAPGGRGTRIERRLGLQASGAMLPFTVLDAEGIPVGMTTFEHRPCPTTRRNRLHLVCGARAAQCAQHAVQSCCSGACLQRRSTVLRLNSAHTSSTPPAGAPSSESAPGLTASCGIPHADAKRHHSRHLRLQCRMR